MKYTEQQLIANQIKSKSDYVTISRNIDQISIQKEIDNHWRKPKEEQFEEYESKMNQCAPN